MKLLIINTYIVTQNKQRKYIPRGFIIITDGTIEKVSAGAPKSDDFNKDCKIIDAKGLVVLPGFINAHVHLGESAFQGLFKEKFSLEDYLSVTEKITQKTGLVEKSRDTIAGYSLLQIIKAGTTTICGGRVADYASRLGIRNVSGYMVMNSTKLRALSLNLEKKYSQAYKKVSKTNISYPAIFIHSLNKIDLVLIPEIKKLLGKFPDTRLVLHIAETKKQEKEIKEKLGLSSMEFLNKSGLLNKNTILIHGNWLSEKDLLLVKKYKSSVVQCLSSNIRVADKVLDFKKVIRNKIKACLATDGVATSGTFSVLDEAQKCFLYYQAKSGISQQKCLDLITVEAAKVLGLGNIVGSVEKGKKADLVFCRNNSVEKNSPLGGINDIYGVMVDGFVKMWDYKLSVGNDKEIIQKFNKLSAQIKKVL